MQAWKIFRHSWMMVFGNLGAAFRVSGVLFAVQLVFTLYWVSSVEGIVNGELVLGNSYAISLTLNAIVATVTSLWIAVAWHRYVLTGESSKGWLPMFKGARMWSYFWHTVLIAIVITIPVFVVAAIVSFGASAILPNGRPAVWAAAFPLLGGIFGIIVFFRLSVILPSVALGKGLSLSEAWYNTRGSTGTILVLGVLVLAVTGASSVLAGPFVGSFGLFSVLWYGVVGWIQTMISVSVLTTFYGHYIEGRALT